jgi:membrane protein required for beta-lactamase induction
MLVLSLPANTDALTRYGTLGVIALVVVGVLAARLVQSVMQRLFSLVIVAVLVVAIWGQRAALADCAHKVRAAASATPGTTVINPTCTLFGAHVTVPIDKATKISTRLLAGREAAPHQRRRWQCLA